MKSSRKTSKTAFGGCCAALLGLLSLSTAQAQIYMSSAGGAVVDEYGYDGSLETSISAEGDPGLVSISGSNLLVALSESGDTAEYTLSGGSVNPSLFSDAQYAMASDGSSIYTVGGTSGDSYYRMDQYTLGSTPGTVASSNLGISDHIYGATSMAVSGSYVYVATGTEIGEYTTAGQTVNAFLLANAPAQSTQTVMTVSGANLFVASGQGSSAITEYTLDPTTGSLLSSKTLVSGIANSGPGNTPGFGVTGLAVSGANIYAEVPQYVDNYGMVTNLEEFNLATGQQVTGALVTQEGISSGLAIGGSSPSLSPTTTITPITSGTSYSKVAPVTSTGGLGTITTILDGTATGDKTVTVSTTNLATQFKSLASDVVSVSGIDPTPDVANTFVLQLTFDLNAANEIGGADAARLLWYDPVAKKWENAVDGNSDGGASAHFVLGSYNPATDFHLGYYGVDTVNDTVWAVIDHNSTFGAGDTNNLPTPTPEPSVWAMLLGGLGLIAFLRRRVVQGT